MAGFLDGMGRLDGASRRVPIRLSFVLVLGVAHVAAFGLLRLIFWRLFRDASPTLSAADTLTGFYLGMKFDARLAVLALLPFLAFGWIPRLDPQRSSRARSGWALYFVALDAFLLLAYAVDFAHFAWMHERVNSTVLDNVLSPLISAQTVWESYPVGWAALGFAILLAADFLLLRRVVRGFFAREELPGRGRIAWIVTAIAVAAIVYGKWSWYPLRWSDAFFSNDTFAAALASNPVLYFADTLADRHPAYDEKELRARYAMLAPLFDVDHPDSATLTFRREITPSHGLSTRPNVVIVFMESFSALKVGRFGHTPDLDPTPEYDAITRKSVFFTHFFVPRPPTARAIFTTLFGIPDVNPDRSASRNPRIVRQHTIANAFEGYDKLYLLGGSANWGNIRGMLEANIPDLRLFEEGTYKTPPDDVWGINDLALLEEANGVFRDEKKPFLAFIQTAGNHPPYTIPKDKRGFEPANVDAKTLEKNGFASLEAYNGIRFMDYAIGNYFRAAKDEPYFKNTVFFLYGDHGTATTLDVPWKTIGLSSHHIPLSIYSPGNLDPRVIDDVVSSVDVLPTAAAIAGLPYVDTTFGRDMLAPRPRESRFAYLATGNTRGAADDEFLLMYDPAGTARLFRYDSAEPAKDLGAELPGKKRQMEELTKGLEQAAGFMLYHNPPVLPQDGGVATLRK